MLGGPPISVNQSARACVAKFTGRFDSLLSREVPIFKPPLNGSRGDDEASAGKLVGQLLMAIALGRYGDILSYAILRTP